MEEAGSRENGGRVSPIFLRQIEEPRLSSFLDGKWVQTTFFLGAGAHYFDLNVVCPRFSVRSKPHGVSMTIKRVVS